MREIGTIISHISYENSYTHPEYFTPLGDPLASAQLFENKILLTMGKVKISKTSLLLEMPQIFLDIFPYSL